ncbi:MAG TPA: hypothetical protein VGG92_20600 [Caulobacteraceae bacterium]
MLDENLQSLEMLERRGDAILFLDQESVQKLALFPIGLGFQERLETTDVLIPNEPFRHTPPLRYATHPRRSGSAKGPLNHGRARVKHC